MRVRGRRRRINGEQGSEAQPGRPARRRGRGVPRGDLDGAGPGRDACRSTRCGSSRTRAAMVRDRDPVQNLPLVDGDAEEVTMNEPTSAEWVIGRVGDARPRAASIRGAGVGDGHRGGEAACAARLAALVGVDVPVSWRRRSGGCWR